MTIPKNINDISQFGPTLEHPKYPGVLGWGFDYKQYRIVMYGPPDRDSPLIKNFYIHSEKKRPTVGEDEEISREYTHLARHKSRYSRRQITSPVRAPRSRGEHPPAHIHVIHIPTGRESKFELIASHDGHDFVEFLPTPNDHWQLHRSQQREVAHVMDHTVSIFIQLWQELYQNQKLSGAVTRTASVDGIEVHERVNKKGWLIQTDANGYSVKTPPPNHTEFNSRDRHRRYDDEPYHGR